MRRLLLLLIAAASAFAQKPNIVFVGDSFTYGYTYPSGTQQAQNYPLQTLLVTNPSQYDGVLHNLGATGMRQGPKTLSGSMLNVAAANVDTLLVAGKKNIVIVEGGLIDINAGDQSDLAVYNNLLQYYSERKTAGWDYVIGVTIMSGQYGASNACYNGANRNGATWVNTLATYLVPSTSATSMTISGSGSKVFTLDQTSLGYDTTSPGSLMNISSRANTGNFIRGNVTAYTGTTLTITATSSGGSGTFSDWNVNMVCECPGGKPACGVSVTGVNDRLRGNKGTADLLLDWDAVANFFNPYDATWRQTDGHPSVTMNSSLATIVGRKINTVTRRIFPMGSAIVNGN